MYALLIKGLLLGLTLSFMIGPLFFSLVEATLARGYRAGIALAAGIWGSDLAFIVLVQKGLNAMKALTELPHFRMGAGLLGGAMLVAFGLVSWLSGRNSRVESAKEQQIPVREKSVWSVWFKGFVINTINPGTLIFWLGTATGIVAPNQWGAGETYLFFGAMMTVLIVTDLLKISGARYLHNWLTPEHIRWVRIGIGMVLMVFGVVLAGNSFGE